jgi:dihydroorotate dehydrogenase (NAD+) catalytic subunit
MNLEVAPGLQTQLAPGHKHGLLLRNPVIIASGPFGYGMQYAKVAEVHRLGALVCKGTTLQPRTGNPHPRTVETASGMLNAIGLQNPGIRIVIDDYAPIWATWQTPVIVNIAGETVDEFVELAAQLEGVSGVAGIEVNVSCPNVRAGGAVFGDNPQVVADVTAAVRHATTLPLIVKLSPNTGDVRPMALAAASSGADAVSLINTITAMRIDIHTRRPILGHATGGLSGPALKPIALRMVYEVACELRASYPQVPVIGLGGISTANDALEFIMAGASAIQIGTIILTNPRAGVEILAGIEQFLRQQGINDIAEIVGMALPEVNI